MAKKHFMCTHTWVGDEAKKMGLENTSQMTDREFFESIKTPRAEMSQPPRTVPVYFGKGSKETWLGSDILMKMC